MSVLRRLLSTSVGYVVLVRLEMSKSVTSPYLLSFLSSGNYCLSCLGLSCCLVCVFLVAVDVVTIPLVRMTPGVSLCGDVSGLLGECLLASGLSRLLFFG